MKAVHSYKPIHLLNLEPKESQWVAVCQVLRGVYVSDPHLIWDGPELETCVDVVHPDVYLQFSTVLYWHV